ncbi:hypothetical protein B1B_03293, partial [mine drainage metagenome]
MSDPLEPVPAAPTGPTPPLATERTPGLTSAEAQARWTRFGPNEVPEEPPHTLRDFAARFWGPSPGWLEAALAIELLL